MQEIYIPVSPITAPQSAHATSRPAISDGGLDISRVSFAGKFVENYDVVRSRVSKSEKSARHFLRICETRLNQETAFIEAADLYKAADDTSNILDPAESAVASSIDVFRLNIVRRIRLSRQFIDDVRHEISNPLMRALENHRTEFIALEQEGLGLVSELKAEYKSHDVALVSFDKAQRKSYELLTKFTPSQSSADHRALGSECYLAIRKERSYHETVLNVNRTRKNYIELITRNLNELEKLERDRISVLRDSMDKMFVYELALCRGIQYDLESAFKEVEASIPAVDNELISFIEKAPSGHKTLPVQIISVSDVVNPPTVIDSPHSPDLQSVERSIINMIWSPAIGKDELEAIEEVFVSSAGQYSFCRALGLQSSELPSEPSFKNLGKVLDLLLSSAESSMDSDSGRRVASFALKFFILDQQSGKKRFMQSEVYHHSLWNRIQFWDEALLLTIFDLYINMYMDRLDHETLDRFPFSSGITIDRFGTSLMVFGISVQSAFDIVRRVMDREELGFLDNESRAEVLSRLENSIRVAHERQERNIALINSGN